MTGLLQDIINHLSVKSECTTVAEYGLTVTVNQAFRLSNRDFRQRNFLAHLLIYMKSLPGDAHPHKRPRESLKLEFRYSVPREWVRLWYH